MATMLAFMATDAPIAAPLLRRLAREVADVSFNGATVDGDTSTNDSFVLAATGTRRDGADHARRRPAPRAVRAAIEACAIELAQAIVRDGEGATKFIAIRVEGGATVDGVQAGRLRHRAFAAREDGVLRLRPEPRPHRVRHRQRARRRDADPARHLVLARRRAGGRSRRARGVATARRTASA